MRLHYDSFDLSVHIEPCDCSSLPTVDSLAGCTLVHTEVVVTTAESIMCYLSRSLPLTVLPTMRIVSSFQRQPMN